MCDCSRIGGVKTRPETERQAIERLTAENVRLRRQVESAEAARTAEIVALLRVPPPSPDEEWEMSEHAGTTIDAIYGDEAEAIAA